MSEKKHHHWKIWLTVFLLLSIIGLALYTPGGKKTMEWLNSGKWFDFGKSNAKYFTVILNTNELSMQSQSYKMSNTTFTANGICHNSIKINDITLDKEGKCSLVLNTLTGNLDFTKGGSIIILGKVSGLNIDDNSYSSAKLMDVSIEIVPVSFTLASVSKDKIVMPSVSGNVSKLKEDGSLSQVSYLYANQLDISNFDGFFKLENGQIIIRGITDCVKSKDFSWC